MLYWFVFVPMLAVLPRVGWHQAAGLATSDRCKELFQAVRGAHHGTARAVGLPTVSHPGCRPVAAGLLGRLLGEGGLQLPQVGGIDVGNSPELQPALTPTQHVVALVARGRRNGLAATRRPHKHVDDVLSSFINDGGNDPVMDVVEPAANQRKTAVGKLEHGRREVHFARKPRLDHMTV